MTADPIPLNPEEATSHAATARRLVEALEGVVLGQPAAIRETVAALLARGHVLLEGVPGTAKTLLVRALGLALGLEFRRIQFTPDLMPSDITGVSLLTTPGTFSFRPGPIFGDLVLGDEINRAPAKTQAALLEAMQERQCDRGRHVARTARGLHRLRDAEPDRVRGHLSAARGGARPLPGEGARRVSGGAGGAGDPRARAGRLRGGPACRATASSAWRTARTWHGCATPCAGCGWSRAWWPTSRPSCGPRARRRCSRWARRRAAAWPCSRWRRRRRCWTGGRTSCPTT